MTSLIAYDTVVGGKGEFVRRNLTIMILVASLLTAESVNAHWWNNKQIVHNTAHSLQKNEKLLGVFTPFGYGITDRISLFIHPILFLLVTPNINLRFNVYDTERLAIAVVFAYSESFLEFEQREFPGVVETGVRFSVTLGRHVVFTSGVDYRLDLFPRKENANSISYEKSVSHGVAAVLGFNFRINESHLISLSGNLTYDISKNKVRTPTGTLLYAYGWERLRLGVGIAAGTFIIQTNDEGKFVSWPVYPVLDLWGRWF